MVSCYHMTEWEVNMNNNETEKKHHHARGRFSGRVGYVLAVAGSAVGLGNIWRFPYQIWRRNVPAGIFALNPYLRLCADCF